MVTFDRAADARAAINSLQDTDLMGRPIYLREDLKDTPGFVTGGGGGGGFGGGGGGGRGGRFSGGGGTGANCKVTSGLL